MRKKPLDIKEIRIEERKRIGEELHSGVSQSLSHALLLLNLHEQKGKQEDLQGVRQAIKMAISEIRHSISELRDEEPWPLFPSVRDCLSDFKEKWQILVQFDTQGTDSNIPAKVRHYVLALIQEGLQNITKHAKARLCAVSIKASRGLVQVVVKDDGIGFDQAYVKQGAPHFGLKFMKERAEQMGGKLSVHSENGRGTILKVLIPYSKGDKGAKTIIG